MSSEGSSDVRAAWGRGLGALIAVVSLVVTVVALVPVAADAAAPPQGAWDLDGTGSITYASNGPEPVVHELLPAGRTPECSNGLDDEVGERISGGAIVPATDGLVDFGSDPDCSSALDGSELARDQYGGMAVDPQPVEHLHLEGSVSGSTWSVSDLDLPKRWISWATTDVVTAHWIVQEEWVVTSASGTVDSAGNATLDVSGELSFLTYRSHCSGFLCFGVPNNGSCLGATFSTSLTTGSSGTLAGQPLQADGSLTLVADDATVAPFSTTSQPCDELAAFYGLGTASTDLVWELGGPPLLANAGLDQQALPGAVVQLDGSASLPQPGANITSYSWAQIAGAAVALSDASSATPTFTAPAAPDTLTFELTVTDDGPVPNTTTDTVDVQVLDESILVDAGADHQVSAGLQGTLSGMVTPRTTTTLDSVAWVQTSGTSVVLSVANRLTGR